MRFFWRLFKRAIWGILRDQHTMTPPCHKWCSMKYYMAGKSGCPRTIKGDESMTVGNRNCCLTSDTVWLWPETSHDWIDSLDWKYTWANCYRCLDYWSTIEIICCRDCFKRRLTWLIYIGLFLINSKYGPPLGSNQMVFYSNRCSWLPSL